MDSTLITSFTIIAQVMFVLGFVVAFFIDHLPWSLRVAGCALGEFPKSTLRSTQILMVNRFGAAFCFTSAGFLVDAGFGTRIFVGYLSLAFGVLGFLTLLYLLFWPTMYTLIGRVFLGIPTTTCSVKRIPFSIRHLFVNYPLIFNMLGVAVPIISAAAVPDYRGSLLQLGFIFNSVSSILLVFFLEPVFVGFISENDTEAADTFHQRFLMSKALLLLFFSFAGVAALLSMSFIQ